MTAKNRVIRIHHGKGAVLLGILVIAIVLRLRGISAGLPAVNDPDELMFELGALRMLDTGSLNPGWFGHPAAITMYSLAAINAAVCALGILSGQFANIKAFAVAVYADPGLIVLPGRIAMVLFSTGCVWLAGRYAAREWGSAAGWTSAALIAVSPVFVAWSQVIRSDVVACFWMLLALDRARAIACGARDRQLVLAALWTACAVVSKWPFALTAMAVLGALAVDARRRNLGLMAALRRVVVYLLLTAAFVIALAPYLILDFSTALRDITGEGQFSHLGASGGSSASNAWWYLSGPLRHGLGITGLALAIAGCAGLARDRIFLAVVGLPLAGFVVLLAAQGVVWERWALPLCVLLSLPAGWAASQLATALARQLPAASKGWAAAVIVVLVVELVPSTWAQSTARQNDTRQKATRWAMANIQPGNRILVEHFGFDLLAGPWTFDFPYGDSGCTDARALLAGKVGNAAINKARGRRAIVDYGTIPTTAEARCRPDYAILTQFDRYAAERDRYPEEYGRYLRLIARGSIVATFRPESGKSAGPVVRIVALDRKMPASNPRTSRSPNALQARMPAQSSGAIKAQAGGNCC